MTEMNQQTRYEIRHWGKSRRHRQFALFDAAQKPEELVAVFVYKKGAANVKQILESQPNKDKTKTQ
jgi:hypothetical protein